MKRFRCCKGVSILYMSRVDIAVGLHESKDTYSSMIVRHNLAISLYLSMAAFNYKCIEQNYIA